MSTKRVPLNVLDLVPVSEGMTPGEAIAASAETAQAAEAAGYSRYWIAEHHNTASVASSATTLLMGRILQETSDIRVGSGGIMLPNHAPLKVAEEIGTLEAMYPGRVDLGLGRAPGTDPMTARELRRGASDVADFAADIRDLQRYLGPVRPEARIIAHPGQGSNTPMYVLGSSTGGATVAAAMGLPFVMATHFAPFQLEEALEVYRGGFDADAPTAQIDRPWVMVAANAMVRDTEEDARFQFSVSQRMFLELGRRGGRGPLKPPTETPQAGASQMEWMRVEATLRHAYHGTAEQVVDELAGFAEATGADEVITVTYAFDPEVRRESIAALGEAWNA
ncbi:LLM class flavin-dependent oxidoreductase [Corynebacterium sp. 335C]